LSVYADTSFFVSSYLTDRHSLEVKKRLGRQPALWLTPLHRAEWSNAIAQHVFRGSLTPQGAQKAYDAFQLHRDSGLWLEVPLPLTVYELTVNLSRMHTPVFGTRALDVLHIAIALELHATEFWTFDDRQAKLATAVGLNVA
jgi:predicted nucleic acid-binding protein